MEQFDEQSKQALLAASRAADALTDPQIRPAHFLAGLMSNDNVVAQVLAGYGLTQSKILSRMSATAKHQPGPPAAGKLNTALRGTLHSAAQHARKSGIPANLTVLARALLTNPDPEVEDLLQAAGTSSSQVLAALDVLDNSRPEAVFDQEADARRAGDRYRASSREPSLTGAGARPTRGLPASLLKFGQDLVATARDGKLTPVYGRARELDRVQTILSRRTKNNPVLIGEAGVGKTAVAEALAQAIADGTCVAALRDRPLFSLDVASLIGGTRARGDFEERIKKVVKEAQTINAIVFIDEIHQIVGAGAASGSIDVANVLKEALARGHLTVLGATTVDEYRKHIEADPALERRMAQVRVDAPTVAQTVDILRAVKNTFATHHRVQYTPAALTAAAELTDRHVRDRQLPDKAIDALDEAGAAASLAIKRSGPQLQEWYTARAQTRLALGQAVAEERYEDAAGLHEADQVLTEQILHEAGVDLGVVDEHAIATVVAKTAGVPVGTVGSSEQDLLLALGDRLSTRVVGQQHAVETVTAVVRRRRVLGSGRPTSLVFAGPTGVGKTELAKSLADVLFGSTGQATGSLVRFDMSEFAEKHTVARLVGAPPGYSGYDEGGQLTEAVRRNPNCVLLLDEVEKAHADVFDVLLQVLEEGKLTDGSGRTVSFADAIVVLTTNLGSSATSSTPVGFTSGDSTDQVAAARRRVTEAVKGHFRPEFVNRLDHIIVFDPLTQDDLRSIVSNLLARPLGQLSERGVSVQLSDSAVDVLLREGYDPTMGARPLRRAITRLLENPLADTVLAGELPSGSTAFVDASSDGRSLVVFPNVPASTVTEADVVLAT